MRLKNVSTELDKVRDTLAEQASMLSDVKLDWGEFSDAPLKKAVRRCWDGAKTQVELSAIDVYYNDLTRAEFLIDDACQLIAELQCKMKNHGESSAADAVRHCNAG